MNKLEILKMKNAFGIKDLRVNVNNKKLLTQVLIYSSNGVFKTSFAKALHYLSIGKKSEIEDRITHENCEIDINLVDENEVKITDDLEGKIIVFYRELYSKDENYIGRRVEEISTLTIDNESKEKINKSFNKEIVFLRNRLIEMIKEAKLNDKKTIEYLTNKEIDNLDINDLEFIFRKIEKASKVDTSRIDKSKIFLSAYNVIDDKNFLEDAKDYITIYKKRLNEELFDEKFNDSNCLEVIESIKKNNYLSEEKKRGLLIKDISYYKVEDIQKVFDEAIQRISKDERVLEACNKLVKVMGTSKEAEKIKEKIQNDPLFVEQLAIGKNRIVLSALKNDNYEISEYLEKIETLKKEYEQFIKDAKSKKSQFEKAIETYKNRFHPIFNIEIKNKEESILGLEIPSITFTYNKENNVELSESNIREILSSGELTALNIIDFIVRYEANLDNNPVIVLDDVVETFDYSNRYAFIEYILDMIDNNVNIIVLTHNYEFYKSLSMKTDKLTKLSAHSDKGTVTIEKNSKLNIKIEDIFKDINKDNVLFTIPFLRETKVMLCQDTTLLDNCLHYKSETSQVTVNDLLEYYKKMGFQIKNIEKHKDTKYLDFLFDKADSIKKDNYYDLSNKVVLSIACRMLIEKRIINENYDLITGICRNQTSTIKKKYSNSLSEKVLDILDRTLISTPDFIHVNAFMYEPLVDIDIRYLKNLYKDIKELKDDEIWK